MSIEDYMSIIDKYGPPANAERVSRVEAEQYRGRLPDGLLEFWITYGRGVWPQGKYQLCDPKLFEPVLEDYFEGDPEFKASDFVVYGYNSFGNLDLCDGTLKSIGISPNFQFFHMGAYKNIPPEGASLDYFMGGTIGLSIDSELFSVDKDGNDLHGPALAKFGPLAPGEMYGFFPAIAMGGDFVLRNVRKVRAREYHATLAALGELKYFQYSFQSPDNRSRILRKIGRQE